MLSNITRSRMGLTVIEWGKHVLPRFSDIFIASHTLHDNRKRRKQVAVHRMKSALSAKVLKKKKKKMEGSRVLAL